MTPDALTAALLKHATGLGFDDGAVVSADAPLRHTDEVRDAVAQGRHGPLEYLARALDARLDVRELVPTAKTVVVLVTSYYAGAHDEHGARPGQAKVSRYAWGADYHNVMRRRLGKLRKMLLQHRPGAQVAPFTDAKPVLERAWAEAAGLGFVGKSTMLIHRQLGTWTFLAGLITDVDLAPTSRPVQTDHCGSCTRCLDACPTDAFEAPFVLDAARCLSTWTVEAPLDAEAEQSHLLGHGWALGCDVCQEVCPWNRFQTETRDDRFRPRAGHVAFGPDEVPEDLAGTPLARAQEAGLRASVRRALSPKAGRGG